MIIVNIYIKDTENSTFCRIVSGKNNLFRQHISSVDFLFLEQKYRIFTLVYNSGLWHNGLKNMIHFDLCAYLKSTHKINSFRCWTTDNDHKVNKFCIQIF